MNGTDKNPRNLWLGLRRALASTGGLRDPEGSRMWRKGLLCWLLLLGLFAGVAPMEAAGPLTIGVLAFRDKTQVVERWQHLSPYLEAALPGERFLVKAYTYEELEAAVRFHYAESLVVAGLLPEGVRTVVDVGSGAGFPGFVVAVARPELRMTLLEADQRKAAFLREASDFAPNVRVLSRRSDEVGEAFDVVISRAVRAEDVLELAERVGRWVMLVGTAPPGSGVGAEWEWWELPEGRGKVWMRGMPERGEERAKG